MSFFLHPFLCPTYYLILQKFSVVVRQHFQLATIPQEQTATLETSLSGAPVKALCISVNTAEARNKQAGRGNRSGTGQRH